MDKSFTRTYNLEKKLKNTTRGVLYYAVAKTEFTLRKPSGCINFQKSNLEKKNAVNYHK